MLALNLTATVYGLGEENCGDPGQVVACEDGAITASGDVFSPEVYTMAIPLPKKNIMRRQFICLLNFKNEKVLVLINDKSNERWIGKRGFDLTPALYEKLTGKEVTDYSSTKVRSC
jgi:hypothetical protein